jgi:hypothetical protein
VLPHHFKNGLVVVIKEVVVGSSLPGFTQDVDVIF